MRYYVTLDAGSDAQPVVVDITPLPNGALEVLVGGRPAEVDVVAPSGDGTAQLSVLVDGRVVDLTMEGQPPEVGVVAGGIRTYVRVESERHRAAAGARTKVGETGVVKSPMPGRVVKLLVAVDDEVEQGQPLLVVEAMKMENEVKARAKGRVAAIHVKVGDSVEGQAKLVTLA